LLQRYNNNVCINLEQQPIRPLEVGEYDFTGVVTLPCNRRQVKMEVDGGMIESDGEHRGVTVGHEKGGSKGREGPL
jgi:hypothetical protein